MKVILFFVGHWFFSLFFQTFFLHRYAAHGMFKMSKFWERTFYILTYISQGSSFLNPRAYAIMHRMHHAYSDTPADPHSPVTSKTLPKMVLSMVGVYEKYLKRREEPPKEFVGGYPEWPILDKMADLWWPRIIWGTAYSLFYIYFATEWWMFLLMPMHYVMGPIHGVIVNWCGHKYGYRNFGSQDNSKNTLFVDFLMMGELFQNNHHNYPSRLNFAVKWFELDPTYPVIKVLQKLAIITPVESRSET